MKYTIGSSISSFLKENETDKAANWKFGDPLSSSKGVMPQPPSGPKSITAQNRSSNRYQKDMERREQPASPSDYEMGGPDKGSEPRGRGRYGSSRHYDVRGHEEKGYGHIDEEPRGRPRHRYSAYSTQKQEFEDPLVYDWDANPAGDKVQADYPLDEGQMMDDWRPYEGPKQQTGAGRTSGVGLPMALRCPTCCRFHMGTDCGPAPAPCIVCGGDHWVKQCNAQAKMLATTYRPGISCPECKTMHKKDCPLPGSCPICLRVHDGLCLKPSGTCRYCGGVHWENGCIRWQTLDEEMGYSAGQAEAKGVRMDMRSLVSEYYSHSYGKVVKGRDQSLPSQTPPPPKQNLPGSYQAIAAEQRSIVPTYATAKAIKRGSGARRRSRSREAKEYKESMMRGDNATGSKSPSYKRRSPTSNSGWVYAPHGRIDSDIVPGPERSLSPASIGNHRRQSSPFSRRPRSPQPPQATDSYIPGKYDDNQPDTTVPKRARDPSREPYGPGVSPPWGDLRVEFGKRRRMD